MVQCDRECRGHCVPVGPWADVGQYSFILLDGSDTRFTGFANKTSELSEKQITFAVRQLGKSMIL